MSKSTSVSAVQAVVLLSGGLDSVAALFWAKQRYTNIQALSMMYGQPAQDAEMAAAGYAANVAKVNWTRLVVSDTVPRNAGLLKGAPVHDPTLLGVSPVNVPGRNVIFASIAAAHASVWFKAGNFDIIMGCTLEDAVGFPDCRPTFIAAMQAALRLGCARHLRIIAPWVNGSKAEAIRTISGDADALKATLASWSCYRREGPCGECSACVKRAAAIGELGLVDACAKPVMVGGDPSRMVG